MFAAGAAQAGEGSALTLLSGPVLGGVSAVFLGRTWLFNHGLPGAGNRVAAPPAETLTAVTGVAVPRVGPIVVAAGAAAAAFLRDIGEAGSTTSGSLRIGLFEGALVLIAYLALRRPLGLETA
jgi:hypothetical protein